jgi:FkbM family methyltransferase
MRLRRTFGFLPATVIDVGANVGDYSRAVTWLSRTARVVAFEPNPAALRELRVRGSSCGWTIFPYALAAENKKTQFHAAAATTLSSLLTPSAGLGKTFGQDDGHVETITVETRRLDELLDLGHYPSPILLKIDVQGAELDVLRGAVGQMSRIDCIKLEISFDMFYEGQSRLPEIADILSKNGFDRFYQEGVNIADRQVRWCDLVFMR